MEQGTKAFLARMTKAEGSKEKMRHFPLTGISRMARLCKGLHTAPLLRLQAMA